MEKYLTDLEMENYLTDLKKERKEIQEFKEKQCPLTLSLISREIEQCQLRRVHVSGSKRPMEFQPAPPELSLNLGITGSLTAPPAVARPTAAFGNIGSSTSKIAPAVGLFPGNPILPFLKIGGGERPMEFHPAPPELSLNLGITGSSTSNITGQSILNMGGPALAVDDPFLNFGGRAKRDCPTEEPSGSKPKKARLIWTQALHDMFVRHITILGGHSVAVPRTILEGMLSEGANVTKDEIKSHLQKYRQEMQRQVPAPQ